MGEAVREEAEMSKEVVELRRGHSLLGRVRPAARARIATEARCEAQGVGPSAANRKGRGESKEGCSPDVVADAVAGREPMQSPRLPVPQPHSISFHSHFGSSHFGP